MRLFVAAEVPEAVKTALAAAQEALRRADADVKWVRPPAMHLTLAFLGETPPEREPAAAAALRAAAAGAAPLVLEAAGLGTFGGRGSPRVVWAGLRGDLRELGALQAALAAGLREGGFALDPRPFSAHLTLGRVRGRRNARALADAVQHRADRCFGTVPVSALQLVQSTLTPAGPVYTVRESVAVGGGGGPA